MKCVVSYFHLFGAMSFPEELASLVFRHVNTALKHVVDVRSDGGVRRARATFVVILGVLRVFLVDISHLFKNINCNIIFFLPKMSIKFNSRYFFRKIYDFCRWRCSRYIFLYFLTCVKNVSGNRS